MPCSQQSTKKYTSRPSPSYPANECVGEQRYGNDGELYVSKLAANGVGRWVLVSKKSRSPKKAKSPKKSRSPKKVKSPKKSRSPKKAKSPKLAKKNCHPPNIWYPKKGNIKGYCFVPQDEDDYDIDLAYEMGY
jgi:hypothetical protein